MKKAVDRFLKYAAVDTQSDPASAAVPSTGKQKAFARGLAEELTQIGACDVRLDEEYGYVYASVPSTMPAGAPEPPVIGFIAHMDTSDAVSGAGVKPRIVTGYDGGDIVLDAGTDTVLSASDFPELSLYTGKDLIVTDGTTLLGADDKAGIAEIMTAAEYLLSHPKLPHGALRIAFTPDEEIGRGADHFDVKGFGADYAYTVDGGPLGELEYENFNAAGALLTVCGRSVHPGEAKGKMKNALLLAQEFHSMLPTAQSPFYTEGYEGFFHLDRMAGSVERAEAEYIIRDHDRHKFEEKKELFLKNCLILNEKYGEGTFTARVSDSYYNMKEKIEPCFFLVEHAKKAMEALGVSPLIRPIRGGTDGARLSFMGLPCPNLCTGGHNFHGKYEYICIQSMETIVDILIRLALSFAG